VDDAADLVTRAMHGAVDEIAGGIDPTSAGVVDDVRRERDLDQDFRP